MKEYDTSKCVPLILRSIVEATKINKSFTICNKTSGKENFIENWKNLSNHINNCQKSCKTIEFKGNVKTYEGWDDFEGLRLMMYYSSNEINVQEEYLLYDIVDVVGIVGGNLGLFIGFSFVGLVTKFFSMLNDYVLK